jgi:translation initiation factor 2 subunit 3
MENKEGMELINVLIAGHIDHGKTTLLERLSGKWADTHSEELKRGITIKLGYADAVIYKNEEYNIEKKGKIVRKVSFIDAPGHEMLMATMLSGAAIVDAAILVVAVNEGIKPQTREHLMALRAKDIKDIIIVQNKIDLVNSKKARENYEMIRKELKGTIAENSPIVPVSAQQGVNINKILEEICKIKIPERDGKAKPVFLVARSFDINKPGLKPSDLHGTVLGGTLKKGVLKIGDIIEIKPGIIIKEANQIVYKTMKTKIIGLGKGNEKVDVLYPGGSASIETELDMSVGKTDALSGNVVSLDGELPNITKELEINYQLFDKVMGSKNDLEIKNLNISETLMISLNTSVTIGIVKKIVKNKVIFSLKLPVVPFKGDKIGLARNLGGHWRLVGYGEVV